MTSPEKTGNDESRYCGAKKRQGEGFCTRPAGWGTDHVGIGCCKLHGGNVPNQRRAARKVQVRREAARLGVSLEVDPATALLGLVYEAAGNVEFYRDLASRLAPPGDAEAARQADEASPVFQGLYGPMRHSSGEPTGEARRHILVQLYDDERDRLKEYAATVVKVGLSERQVEVAELQAVLVARVVMSLLDDPDLGLSFEQRQTGRRAAGRHLRQLSAAVT